jgi:hypothetical protein
MSFVKTLRYAFVALLAMGLLSGCKGKTVATVNGKKIGMKQYEQQTQLLQALYPDQALDAQTRRQVLEQMVKQELLVQAAEQRGLAADPTLTAQIEEERIKYRQALERKMAGLKAQLGQVDEAVRSRSLIEALVKAEAAQHPVNPAEVKALYNKMKQQGLPVRSMAEEQGRITEQVMLDRLVDQAREKGAVDMNMDLVTAGAPPSSMMQGLPGLPPAQGGKLALPASSK